MYRSCPIYVAQLRALTAVQCTVALKEGRGEKTPTIVYARAHHCAPRARQACVAPQRSVALSLYVAREDAQRYVVINLGQREFLAMGQQWKQNLYYLLWIGKYGR